MNKKTLFIIATHGDEKIGFNVVANLKKLGLNEKFDFIIGNPRASGKNKRFLEADLNRSYPGNKNSSVYEERLAYENLQTAKKYRWVIDMHEADQGKDDFIIIPRKKMNRFPIERIDLPKVLLWPDPKGPLGQVVDNEIELEFGVKNKDRKELEQTATKIVQNFLLDKEVKDEKEIYRVYGKILAKNYTGTINELIDFQEIEINKEQFYPLLVGQYLKLGIICYKMKSFNV